MRNQTLKKLLPHLVALVAFLLVTVIFCKPVLEGNVLNQHDTIGWRGMAQNAFEYKEKHGHFPLWNPNLFSGMPNYQVAMEGKSILPDFTKILAFGLPKPMNFFFLACVCFYILGLVLGARPVVAAFGALAYAYSTYNAVVINAGHDTQMLATAFMPLLLAGILCTFQKKYWLGLALTTLGAYQQIGVNHLQISYYFFIIATLVTIFYVYRWIRAKDWKHLLVSAGITALAAIVGLAGSALLLLTTSEYTAYTMRGGKDLEIAGDSVRAVKTKGLDTSYAFVYSIGKAETSTLMMPNAFGGSHARNLDEKSNVVKKLVGRGVNEMNAAQLATSLPAYWGALPYTAGPAYLGVMICVLGIIGFVLVRSPLRWGLLAATVLGIFMSWGKNFAEFNTFLFQNLPLYNKFRAPSMAQVVPQFTVGIMAVVTLQQLLFNETSRELLREKFRKLLFAVGGLFGLLILLYIGMDYSAPIDQQLLTTKWDESGNDEIGRLIVSGLKQDRRAMFGGQLLRALGLTLLLLGILYFYMKGWFKRMAAALLVSGITTLELTMISYQYLGEDQYVSKEEFNVSNFSPSAADQQILQDRDPHFRVFNMASDTYNESRTSYFHKSVGGYHPAKLRIYQDVIEMYLSNRPTPGVLNMLNTKYIIVGDPQTRQTSVLPNPEAFGAAWLVKHVSFVENRVEAIKTIGETNLRDTAVVERALSAQVTQPQWDSTASIRLVRFSNDTIDYEVNASAPQFAVFSEIYYPKGWNAYLDGNQVPYVNTNYILRGMPVPAGKHQIRFIFEPSSFRKGYRVSYAASFLVLLLVGGGLFLAWRQERKQPKRA
ncbi:MAG TPA: YfhO family protein [Chitinophagaceae bacterium]|nr:YfhO family protein [Chitinophagaceae bacterium]